VFGIGCVGLSILQGARAKGCKRVFAIDTNPSKEEWAKKFGASTLFSLLETRNDIDLIADFVNPKDLPEGKSIVEYLVEETDGGLDYTYDATGVVRSFPSSSLHTPCLSPYLENS
jgi:S-(hydroxymethyl)glutathione dehydrogenase/alcohol dehydrogenase